MESTTKKRGRPRTKPTKLKTPKSIRIFCDSSKKVGIDFGKLNKLRFIRFDLNTQTYTFKQIIESEFCYAPEMIYKQSEVLFAVNNQLIVNP